MEGKPPVTCEALLEFGPPLLSVRSRNTGQFAQLYNATRTLDLSKTVCCILRYDEDDYCEDFDLVEVAASTKARPF